MDRPDQQAEPRILGLRMRRLHETVTHDIGVAIVSGRYRPGDVLSGEIASSEQLKVSRSAYREAVRTLAAKGLVESRPKAGTRVSPRARWNLLDPDVLAWFFETRPDEAFVNQLFELRMIVEPTAAALAARRRGPGQLKRLSAALEAMAAHTLATEAGRAADRDFHDILLEATGNELLIALTSSIGAAVAWTTLFKQRTQALPRDPVPEHRAVLDAIAAGDADGAREAMTNLVRLALEDTRRSMAPG